jgi:hypothetical protein
MSVSRTCLHRPGNVVHRHKVKLLPHEAASGSARNLGDRIACRIIKRIVWISQPPGFVTASDLPGFRLGDAETFSTLRSCVAIRSARESTRCRMTTRIARRQWNLFRRQPRRNSSD